MKCPNCGSELRKGLSFCPKCGNVVSQNKQEVVPAQNSQSVQPKKKTSVWKIILGILFFPIALTIIIAKNKKMKPIMKIVLIVILWIFVLVVGASNSDETPSSNDNNISDSSYEEKVDDEAPTSHGSEQLAPPESGETDNTEKTDVPDAPVVTITESQKLVQYLYSIETFETLTQDQATSLAEKQAITSDVDMGWGGTSWQYYFKDAENDDCSVTLFFVEPQKENFAEHLKYMTYHITNDDGISLYYYSEWNRDNDDDGKYGYYVGDTQFSTLTEAHEYYYALVLGKSDDQSNETTVTVKYHNNEHINRLLAAYNAIAEYPITPEMVQDGAYDFKANVSCNGVWIAIYATSNNGMFVDYDDEAANDGAIQPIFRDFCKALNSDITDDDANSAWEILQTEEYQNYSPYDFEGIECTYSESPLSNGEHRYIVKTNCKSYC